MSISTTNTNQTTSLPFSSIMSLVETVTAALPYALLDGEISAWDMVVINQIVTDHGRTYRASAMVREYLDNRDNT